MSTGVLTWFQRSPYNRIMPRRAMMKFSYGEIPIYQHNSNQFTTEYSVVALPLSSACLTPGVDDYHMDIFFFFVLFCGL